MIEHGINKKRKPLLSIIIPVFNEKKTIAELIKRVDNIKISSVDSEIILVDDGSTDGTREKLKSYANKHTVLFHKKNQGKGAAIRTGLLKARGDILVIQDADLEYDPNDLKKLIKPILAGKTKVVYGNRFANVKFSFFGRKKTMHPLHYFGNRFLSIITMILYFNKVTDMETCYKMFKREVIKGVKLRARRFDFEPEITAKILKRGYKILEMPIRFRPRKFEEGKKITWKDGVKHLGYLLRYRFFD